MRGISARSAAPPRLPFHHPAAPAVTPATPFVTPAPEPGSIYGSRRNRSRWRTGSTAETAARTEAGPRIKSGATVGGRGCEVTGRRCVNPVGLRGGRQVRGDGMGNTRGTCTERLTASDFAGPGTSTLRRRVETFGRFAESPSVAQAAAPVPTDSAFRGARRRRRQSSPCAPCREAGRSCPAHAPAPPEEKAAGRRACLP